MSTVHLGRGSVVVEEPTDRLMSGLRRFKRNPDGSGEYEDVFTLSQSGDTLVTLPGFADRVLSLLENPKVIKEKSPMPKPDWDSALSGIDPVWHEVVKKAIRAGGGVIGIPEVLGTVEMAAALIRAWPRDHLVERGTPLAVIAAKDREAGRRIALALRKILPDRDIGISSSGSYTDSDDVIVTTYGSMDEVPLCVAGLFIGDDMPGVDFVSRAENVSMLRNAARYGFYVTAAGGCPGYGMDVEGLFGNLVASATYADAIKGGVGVPVTVCWLPSPRPKMSLGSADVRVLEAMAMQNNPEFVDMVAHIVREVSPDVGCLVSASNLALIKRVKEKMPELVECHRRLPAKGRRVILEDISIGTVRKAIVSYGCFPLVTSHDVMIVANCGGADVAGERIPWRKKTHDGEKTYMVDFRHAWDVHNGRSGRLALNDEARTRRYKELGFNQILVSDVAQLPFIGG